jgi:hypothetical protein
MKKTIGLIATIAVLAFSATAQAHGLKLECKKISADNVVCRTIMSDGEVARNIDVQLLADEDYKVVARAKTDAEGKYAFKVPSMEYHIVATGDKAHVASVSSTDIW